jgi:transcriptional regulator with XRE-family HTH domain
MYTQLGHNINIYRKKAKLTQKQLGEKIGVSQQMVAYYINGKQSIKYSTAKQIATALNINVSDLYTRIPMGSYLRYARIKNQLTKQQLGDLIGVSSNLIKEWENSYSLDDSIINKFQNIFENGDSHFLDKAGDLGYDIDSIGVCFSIENDPDYLDYLDPDIEDVEAKKAKKAEGFEHWCNADNNFLYSYNYEWEIDSNGNMCYVEQWKTDSNGKLRYMNDSNRQIKTSDETVIFQFKREWANNDKHIFEIYSGSKRLNALGRSEAIKRIIELLQIPKYQSDSQEENKEATDSGNTNVDDL